jgi:Tol biopolymer transport system component
VVFHVEDAGGASARLARLGSVLKRQVPVVQAEFEYIGAAQGRNTTPVVTADGQKLYYSTNRFWPGWDICSLDLKSGREDCFLNGWSSYCRPKLAPSGQFLAFSGGVSDRIGIYKYDFKTKTSSKLLDLEGKDYDISFIDDQRFFFSSQNGKKEFSLYQFQGPSQQIEEILGSKYSVRFPSYSSL